MRLSSVQWTGLGAAVMAGMVLLTAVASERWGGLVPCALCLVERWPYRVAILLGLLAVAWRRGARVMVALAGVVMLAGAGLGATHVGVEQGWWPSPLPECAAPDLGGGSVAERLARMPARPAKPCDEPAYLMPGVTVSMAEMNLGLSVLLGVGLLVASARRGSAAVRALS